MTFLFVFVILEYTTKETNMADIKKKIERIVKQAFPGTTYVDFNWHKGTKDDPYWICVYAYRIAKDYLTVVDGKMGTCDFDLTKKIAQNLIRYGYKNFTIELDTELEDGESKYEKD